MKPEYDLSLFSNIPCCICGKSFKIRTVWYRYRLNKGKNRFACSMECKKKSRKEYCYQYYRKNKDKVKEYHRQWYQKNKEKRLAQIKFYHVAHSEQRKKWHLKWRQRNRDHIRFLQRATEARHRDKRRLKNCLWYQRNKGRRKKYNRLYRLRNIDHVRAAYRQYAVAHRDRLNAYQRAWIKRHPEWVKINAFRRRTQGRLASGTFSRQDLSKIRGKQNNLCFYCQCSLEFNNTRHGATIDHLIPLTRNGTNWPENLVAACRSCNSKKRTMTVKEYLHQLNDKSTLSLTQG